MPRTLGHEQSLMVETARRIGTQYGLSYWRSLDAEKAFPEAIWQEICDAGLCGIALPEDYGGSGLGLVEMALVIEALAAAGAGATVAQLYMLNPIFGGISISRFGNPKMREELLPRIVSGNLHFCMALTEPDAGTNTLGIETVARRENDCWRLSGRKTWITGVPQSGKMLVIARTLPTSECTHRSEGISLFVVDTDRDGISHAAIDKLGTNTLPASSIFFDDVQVHDDELIGDLHRGWNQLLEVLNAERIVTTAGLVGATELAIRLAVEYASERKVFKNTPIGAYQGLQFPLAQAHALNECARLMNHRAAELCDRGEPFGSEANIAKLIAAQAASQATERAMQTMGGMGYAKEFHVERLWRDVRLFRFAPVSEEMILNFIAQHDLGMPRSY